MSKKQEMINDLIRVAALFKEEINNKDFCQRDFYLEHGEFSKKGFVDEFGSFSNFKKEAMLQDGYTPEDVTSYAIGEDLEEHFTLEENIDGTYKATSRSNNITSARELLVKNNFDPEFWEAKRVKLGEWGKEGKMQTTISAIFTKKDPSVSPELIAKDIITTAKNYVPKYKKINYKKFKEGCLLEIALFDHHFGQLSWNDETRQDSYDLKISKKLAEDAFDYMLSHSKLYNIEKILIPIGNDFFNSNSSLNATFSGTSQSEDDRWQKTFVGGWHMWKNLIENAMQVAPVDVIIVTGNHDKERIYYLGETLNAWFNKTKNVSINNSPTPRKYYQWGETLIGYTHGHAEVKTKGALVNIMATEVKDLWAKTTYREWHKGHLHHAQGKVIQYLDEHQGVREIILPSLVSIDDWHSEKGYSALRESIGNIYNFKKGNVNTIRYRP